MSPIDQQKNVHDSHDASEFMSWHVQTLRKRTTVNNESFQFDIPVKAHINKFLDKKLQGPVYISLSTTIGIFLYHLFRRQQQVSKYDKVVVDYPHTYPVVASKKALFDYGARNVTSYSAVQFNRVWENELRYECFTHVEYSTKYRNLEQKQAIEEFLDRYDFEDSEISYQTLVRYMCRIRSSKKNNTSPLVWDSN
jgi:hypothetical protein